MNSPDKSAAAATGRLKFSAVPAEAPIQAPTASEMASTQSPSRISKSRIEWARDKGVIVFRTDTVDDESAARVQDLRSQLGEADPIVAITGASTTISDVRRLARAGATEVVPDTIADNEFVELIDDILKPPPALAGDALSRSGEVIAVCRARGGVGATTVAVNLADALLEKQGRFKKTATKSVALIDLDMQMGDIASFLDTDRNNALFDLAMTQNTPDQTYLEQAMVKLPCGVSVLSAPEKFAPLNALGREQVARIIELLRQAYDYVVLDLPPGLVEWMDTVIEDAGVVLMVTDCAVPSIHQARRLIDFFAESNPHVKVEIVVNHEAKPMLLRSHQAAAEKALDRKFNHWIPEDVGSARAALDRGVPLSSVAPRSAMTKAISRLARSVAASLENNHSAAATAN